MSQHLARIIARAIDAVPDKDRSEVAGRIALEMLQALAATESVVSLDDDVPTMPVQVLRAILERRPDGSPDVFDVPLTPLLDTTLLTNSPGEPSVSHELQAEVQSADSIDLVMAFVRWSGIFPFLGALRKHCERGKRLRLVTTTYTNSTELKALEELAALGTEIKVSYDTSSTRLHAKAWHFRRLTGYSTAYIGSSNLTRSALVTGLEWNVRVSQARNPDVVAKMDAVFESYWASGDFVDFRRDEFVERTKSSERDDDHWFSPIEIELRPFQERLLEEIELARRNGHHRNLLVAATGTGKTVMAAVDYARLRKQLPRARLLFVAHREEILRQSRAMFCHALLDASFGELWVRNQRPSEFNHVFASIQSLNASGVAAISPEHFDVVVVDEFHHAAAPSYRALLEQVRPVELLGLTATPERADGLDVRSYFDGRIAAELRVWDAIDHQYLAPFAYYGIHDGSDLAKVPWKRSTGYDVNALTDVLTADHAWARRVITEVGKHVADVHEMKALGFCVSIRHAHFMAEQFRAAGIAAVAISGESGPSDRANALRNLATGDVNAVFAVDLFNEGVDVPDVDTLLFLRPTESATLFLQQLGRGLRRAREKAACTVLDFVGNQRREFRFDLKLRALLGGSRASVERQVEGGFPFLPSGCTMQLDPVARDIVLRSIREALPSTWPARCQELRSVGGDVTLAGFLDESGLDLEDVYASGHTWSEMRRAAGLPTAAAGPKESQLLRAVGRLLHVDDVERLNAYRELVLQRVPPGAETLRGVDRRFPRMLLGSITSLPAKASVDEGLAELWEHPQVRAELAELFELLPARVGHMHTRLDIPGVPLAVHARYTRAEILAAFDRGAGVKEASWQAGVLWDEASQTDLFAFTLDKSAGSFSPTTRYRDYAISPELIHWESQSVTALASPTGQRYINQRSGATNVVLFARLSTADRALWCLGTAQYVSHEGERPIAITWKLDHRLAGDLFASFAAAVA